MRWVSQGSSTETGRLLGNIIARLRTPGIASEELLAFFVADLFEFHYRNLENGEPPVIRMLQGLAASPRPFSPAAAARLCGYSRDYLNRQVHKRFGVSLKGWLDRELAGRARRSLDYSSQGVTEIATELGFSLVYAFSRFFSRVTGMSPASGTAQQATPCFFRNASDDLMRCGPENEGLWLLRGGAPVLRAVVCSRRLRGLP